MCGPRWQKPASADLGPEAVLLSAVAGLVEKAVPFAVESSRTAARVTRHGLKAIESQATSYRYAGMAELADATDLKSVAAQAAWEFEPPSRHYEIR